jgi:hypothetical protein
MSRMLWHAPLIWYLILACAIANGVLREAWLVPAFGHPAGLLISGLLLSGVVLIAAILSIRRMGGTTDRQAPAIGASWLVATLMFEYGFDAGIRHRTQDELLAAYAFNGDKLCPPVLAATLLAPFVAHRLSHR